MAKHIKRLPILIKNNERIYQMAKRKPTKTKRSGNGSKRK